MRSALEAALAEGHGLLVVRQHPRLRSAVGRAARAGQLERVHRGIYAIRGSVTSRMRCLALALAEPDIVFTGATALWLLGKGSEPRCITAVSRRIRRREALLDVRDRHILPEHIVELNGLRVSEPARAVLDHVAAADDPGPIDSALRTGLPLTRLWEALEQAPSRPGNRIIRRWLRDSWDEPWSPAERVAHRLLRRAGVRGWRTNRRVALPGGLAYLDIAFDGVRVALEIDGFAHHQSRDAFLHDRRRDVQLSLAGWSVHRFAATDVFADPDGFVDRVTALLRLARRRSRDGHTRLVE